MPEQLISPEIGYRRLLVKSLLMGLKRTAYYLKTVRELRREDYLEIEELIYFFDNHFPAYMELLDIPVKQNPFLQALKDKYVFKKEVLDTSKVFESLDTIENMLQ